jgi:flagellin-like protein
MKKAWAIRRDMEAVSPVIGTILMVAITVVLVAVLYVTVSDLGKTSNTPVVAILSTNAESYGYKVTLTNPTSEVRWGEVMIQLSDGVNTVTWLNFTTDDLVSATAPVVWKFGGSSSLGSLSVFLNVTDMTGNGRINMGDYLVFTTFASPTFLQSVDYKLTLLYKPTGGQMLFQSIN